MSRCYFDYSQDAYMEGKRDYEYGCRTNYDYDKYSDRERDRAYFDGQKDAERERERQDLERREEQERQRQEQLAYERERQRQCDEEEYYQRLEKEKEVRMSEICNHDLAERETACADGMCPICQQSIIKNLREGIQEVLTQTLPYHVEKWLKRILEVEE